MLLGVGPRAVDHRLAVGRLHRVHDGVYAVGHRSLTDLGRAAAAVLACGGDAVLGLEVAAWLANFAPPPAASDALDVIVPGRSRRDRPGLRLHRHRLLPGEVTRLHGLPVTTCARTLLDLAAITTPDEHERLVAEAFAQRRVTREQLVAVLAAHSTARGAAALRASIDAGLHASRSGGERAFLLLVRQARLPEPEVNVRIGEWRPDFLWRAARLVVEVDGYAAHSSPWAVERDRRKEAALRREGLDVMRFSGRQLASRPLTVVADVTRALALGAARRPT